MASTEINFELVPFLLNLLRAFRAELDSGDPLDGVDVVKFLNLNTVDAIEDAAHDIVIYFDLYEIEPDNDPKNQSGTAQLTVNLMFQAYVLVKPSVGGASLKARQFALALATILHDGDRFGSPVGPAVVTDCINLPPLGDERVIVWSVEWMHCTWVSSSEQICDDPPVDASQVERVLLGFPPDVGVGHESDYETVVEP